MTIRTVTARMPRSHYTRYRSQGYGQSRSLHKLVTSNLDYVVIAFAVFLLLIGIFLQINIHGLNGKIESLTQQYVVQTKKVRKLEATYQAMTTKEKLSEIGKKLGFRKPEPRQIVRLD